jgi:diguanylate cyclase (GGDEF)-like protein/PAS domain S-box-containing protein
MELQKEFLETIPLPTLILDKESEAILAANTGLFHLLTRKENDLEGLALRKLFTEAELNRLRELLRTREEPLVGRFTLLNIKRQKINAEMRARSLDHHGRAAWLITFLDITNMRKVMESLRISEENYRRVVENTNDAIAIINAGQVIFLNTAFEKMMAPSSPAELWGITFEYFIHELDLPLWKQREQEVMEHNVTLPLAELRIYNLDGESLEVEVSQYPSNHLDQPAMLVTLRDIRARKEIERRLKESEERYKGLAEVAFDGVTVHQDYLIQSANRAFENIFGYGPGELTGKNFLDLIIASERGFLKKKILIEQSLELVGIRKDGSSVIIEAASRSCSFQGQRSYITAIRNITERKKAEKAIRQQAYFDSLTGLPNRLTFNDRLHKALTDAARSGKMLAVLFLDLDHFKNVNDSLGHEKGDDLLRQVAARMSAVINNLGTLSRLGGDEFTLVMPNLVSTHEAEALAKKIIDTVNQPYELGAQSVHIGVSIGIAVYPQQGTAAADLIRRADQAMYRAKESGRNTQLTFEPGFEAASFNKVDLDNQLRQALRNKEFVLHFQPKVDLKTGRLVGAETLVRWQKTPDQLAYPAEFLPLAEETGLIIPLGDWIMRTAARQASAWKNGGLKHITVSVNLSSWQLHHETLLALVKSAIKENGLDPGIMELEITETTLSQNPGFLLSALEDLAMTGVKLSLDDFGKG